MENLLLCVSSPLWVHGPKSVVKYQTSGVFAGSPVFGPGRGTPSSFGRGVSDTKGENPFSFRALVVSVVQKFSFCHCFCVSESSTRPNLNIGGPVVPSRDEPRRVTQRRREKKRHKETRRKICEETLNRFCSVSSLGPKGISLKSERDLRRTKQRRDEETGCILLHLVLLFFLGIRPYE